LRAERFHVAPHRTTVLACGHADASSKNAPKSGDPGPRREEGKPVRRSGRSQSEPRDGDRCYGRRRFFAEALGHRGLPGGPMRGFGKLLSATVIGFLALTPGVARAGGGDASPTGKGITGGALLGAEAVMLSEAAASVKPAWAYAVG